MDPLLRYVSVIVVLLFSALPPTFENKNSAVLLAHARARHAPFADVVGTERGAASTRTRTTRSSWARGCTGYRTSPSKFDVAGRSTCLIRHCSEEGCRLRVGQGYGFYIRRLPLLRLLFLRLRLGLRRVTLPSPNGKCCCLLALMLLMVAMVVLVLVMLMVLYSVYTYVHTKMRTLRSRWSACEVHM